MENNELLPLITIMGPTASGKSSFAIELAKEIEGEIISADSAQVYKELSIITARVTNEEMQGIPHYLMGIISLKNDFSLSQYQTLAYKYIKDIIERKKYPILVGGTNLYIKSVTEAYNLPNIGPDWDIRNKLRIRAKDQGKQALYKELSCLDPEAARRIHPNNLHRVIRALEVIQKTGRKFSYFYKKIVPHPLGVFPYYVWIDIPREELYNRVNKRVDVMMESGALEEIRRLLEMGYEEDLKRLKILGTREILGVVRGEFQLKEGIELIKRNTRKYAKRQETWVNSFDSLSKFQILTENNKVYIERLKKVLAINATLK